MGYSHILIEAKDAVEIVTLNRPEALNMLSVEMVRDLTDYFEGLRHRTSVRVVILRAVGRAFCAGIDLNGWEGEEGRSRSLQTLAVQTAIGNIYRRMRACPQPIISIAQGAACGGGMSLLPASDVRYGTPSLRMNAAYIKIGLSGCDMGSSYFLPRLVGSSLAAEMLLTGRFVDAERALRHGLISDIVAEDKLLETAMALADDMLSTSPQGLRMTKEVLGMNIDAPNLEAAMAIEDRQQVLLSATQDHLEAVNAFFEKRKPMFKDN